MRHSRLLATLTAFAVCLLVSACGHKTEAIEPISWPHMESMESLSINGKDFQAYVASTEQHRRRAINGLAIKEGQAIAMLFPERDEAIELEFRSVPDPIDLVFLNAKAEAVLVQPVPAFSRSTFPRRFGGKDARVVLQLQQGAAAQLGIELGKAVTTTPDLVGRSADAEDEFARMYFLRNERAEDKPELSPHVKLKVLNKAEEVARLMKDRENLKEGQGVLVPVGQGYHQFWLKEVQGEMCAAWIENAQGTSILASIYEGIKAGGGSDLDEPVYYSAGKPTYLAIWRGSDYFTANKINRRSPVRLTGVNVSSHDKPDYGAIELKFGDSLLTATLAATEDARQAALKRAPALEPDRAFVLAWDDPTFVELAPPAGLTLWHIGADYKVARKERTTGDKIESAATSRFVIIVPEGFEPEAELEFPYVLRDLKPSLPAVVFYSARQADVVTDRWPGPDNNFKARARVELAVTPAEQRRGLMFRESLKPGHGMLFIYKQEEPELSYWMKNCRMNLSIAFVNSRGMVVAIHNNMLAPEAGTPDHALPLYSSQAPAKFAVEMEENWFSQNNIVVGDRIFIPPALADTSE